MAWRRIGDKPFSEPMLILFTDAYMRHSGEMNEEKRQGMLVIQNNIPKLVCIKIVNMSMIV